jgi:NADPH:quinone reductase-like Zn-dependent oxidoreductase
MVHVGPTVEIVLRGSPESVSHRRRFVPKSKREDNAPDRRRATRARWTFRETPVKAIVYHHYGSADVLRVEDLEKPTAADKEVLIKVRAASVNPLDWHYMRGTPYLLRIGTGLRQPKNTRLGVDVSGQVEAVGRNVTQFTPGDDVFGACRGAFAQYACASESAVVMKPDNVTFDQAASVPIAALTALQALCNRGRIQPGQHVLINGAAGGVGTFAVQIARSFGADVTGVCSTRNVEMVRSIGADRVVDYTREDFTSGGPRYDLFLDCVGNRSLSACRRVLTPKGIYVEVGAPDRRWIGPLGRLIEALVLSWFVSHNMSMFLTKLNKEDLTALHTLTKTGKVIPVIDSRYTLSEVPEAIRHLEEGHARGKVVITVDHSGTA